MLAPSLTGTYRVTGKCPKVPSHSGVVTVSEWGENYEVVWTLEEGKSYSGTGCLRGNFLAIAYSSPGDSGFGVGLYEILGNGSKLTGNFTDHLGKERGTEEWEKQIS
jgi:hypothetical protein